MNDPVQITTKCSCGSDQVLRTNGKTGGEFLGCSDWPTCKRTAPAPAWLEMRRAGVQMLPGLEIDS